MTAVKKARSDEAALRKARMLIGGKWVESASGEVLEVEDPAHRRPVAEIPRGMRSRALTPAAPPGSVDRPCVRAPRSLPRSPEGDQPPGHHHRNCLRDQVPNFTDEVRCVSSTSRRHCGPRCLKKQASAKPKCCRRQALEIEFLKGALKSAPRPRSASTSVITGPVASPSSKDAG